MVRKILLLLIITSLNAGFCNAQAFIRTAELFSRPGSRGSLNIDQSSSVDTLLSRYIISKKSLRTSDGNQAILGVRIQIYQSSVRTAREEANKVMLQFLNDHGDMKAYVQYQDPGWYKVRVGNYRSQTEAYKDLMMIRKQYPSAYAVQDKIPFPDQIK
jgi:phage-related protein